MSSRCERQLGYIIPTPKKIEKSEERILLSDTICVAHEAFLPAASTLCASVKKIFGKDITLSDRGIMLIKDDRMQAASYSVDTRGDCVILRANDFEGICYALSTFIMMITERDGELCLARSFISDAPDRDYRALMVDLAREWHPLNTILKYIDVCFMLKIKYLHLHFIDDQRYTLPSCVLPELTKYSEHYTLDDIEKMRAYANERSVIIVPEFEVPGHAAMLVRTYPEIFALRAKSEDGATIVSDGGAIITAKNIICAGSSVTHDAVSKLIDEVCKMFPESPYIHIGGDEANINAWNDCHECVDYMREHGISDVHELYSEFVGRVAQMVIDNGRTPIVWEGFPEKGVDYIPKETIVIAWESLYQLAPSLLKHGFRVINGSWKPLYIVPSYQNRWGAREILDWNVYTWQHWWDRSPAKLNPIHVPPTDQVLGAQISAWECTYEEEIGKVLESLPTLSELTWNTERLYTTDEFLNKLRHNVHRIARLIADV